MKTDWKMILKEPEDRPIFVRFGMATRDEPVSDVQTGKPRLRYARPQLTTFGRVLDLTKSGGSQGSEGSSGKGSFSTSDRRAKQGIVQIGTHPLGIGLYLYEYREAYKREGGDGRQFGVLADEVLTVMPEAVVSGPDGIMQVDYAMLGIAA